MGGKSLVGWVSLRSTHPTALLIAKRFRVRDLTVAPGMTRGGLRSQLDVNARRHPSPATLSRSFMDGGTGSRHVRSNGRSRQRIEHGLHHTVEVSIDVGIPKMQHTEALTA